MSDTRSPLQGHFNVGTRQGAAAAVLTFREIDPGSLVQVQAWPDALTAAAAVLASAAGVRPAAIGYSASVDGTTVMTLAPGRWLIRSARANLPAALSDAVTVETGAVTDLGHARHALRIEGAAAARMLNKHLPVDLDSSVFPPGRVAQSMIHHIDVTVLREDDERFLILAFRGFALSLFETLCDASLEFGYRLEKADRNA